MSKLVIFGDFAPNQLCLTYPKKGLLTSQRFVSGQFFGFFTFWQFYDHENHHLKSLKNHQESSKNRVLVFIKRSTGFLIKLIFSCNNQF